MTWATRSRGGAFREDLFFRLNVVSLRLPPLRERPGDIAALADHYARHYAELKRGFRRAGSRRRRTPCCAGIAGAGNVRELENTLHRAVLLASGDVIDTDAIELAPGDDARLVTPMQPGSMMGTGIVGTGIVGTGIVGTGTEGERSAAGEGIAALVGRRMEDVERDLILQTLGHTLGNRTHAATILGISIRALRNKLRDYTAGGTAVPPPLSGLGSSFAAQQYAP